MRGSNRGYEADLRDGKGKNRRRRIAFGDVGWEVVGGGWEGNGKGTERG